MGERATIRVIQSWSDTPIHFYTHWSGDKIAEILAHGLYLAKETGRLDDEAYATRIVFDALTGLQGGSTGYGIIIGDEAGSDETSYASPTLYWFQGQARVEYKGVLHTADQFISYWRNPEEPYFARMLRLDESGEPRAAQV